MPLGAACRAKAQVPPIKRPRAAQRWHKYDTYYGNINYYYHYYYYYYYFIIIIIIILLFCYYYYYYYILLGKFQYGYIFGTLWH